eukprot:TRINITY_DN60035_c0_g1_i1.p1 TRINITY_DN60035_c0_g1~~TRINITY_DN60035_c0_g1_i1.p1  ORF type:complete len:326 (+),score=71.23 TRINITY_DN60035_c0_g1_i1:81-1058(+)
MGGRGMPPHGQRHGAAQRGATEPMTLVVGDPSDRRARTVLRAAAAALGRHTANPKALKRREAKRLVLTSEELQEVAAEVAAAVGGKSHCVAASRDADFFCRVERGSIVAARPADKGLDVLVTVFRAPPWVPGSYEADSLCSDEAAPPGATEESAADYSVTASGMSRTGAAAAEEAARVALRSEKDAATALRRALARVHGGSYWHVVSTDRPVGLAPAGGCPMLDCTRGARRLIAFQYSGSAWSTAMRRTGSAVLGAVWRKLAIFLVFALFMYHTNWCVGREKPPADAGIGACDVVQYALPASGVLLIGSTVGTRVIPKLLQGARR